MNCNRLQSKGGDLQNYYDDSGAEQYYTEDYAGAQYEGGQMSTEQFDTGQVANTDPSSEEQAGTDNQRYNYAQADSSYDYNYASTSGYEDDNYYSQQYDTTTVCDYPNYSSASSPGQGTGRGWAASGGSNGGQPFNRGNSVGRGGRRAWNQSRGRGTWNQSTGRGAWNQSRARGTSNRGTDRGGLSLSSGQFARAAASEESNTKETVTPKSSTVGQFGYPVSVSSQASTSSEASTSQTEKIEEDDDSSSDDDFSFCKYCKIEFKTIKGFHEHTRGLRHINLYMEAKAAKGDKKYQKEIVAPEVLEVHIPAPKPVKEEKEDPEEDYGLEENWMNLDDDVLKYIKQRREKDTLDLHPEDIGKSHLTDEFSCPLCEIKCTGAQAFQAHIAGKQHNNKLELAQKGVRLKRRKPLPSGVHVETKDKPAKILEIIEHVTQPIVGLDFVTEFQKADYKAAPRYVCNLCESKCDGATIMPHVVGFKHRTAYFKLKAPEVYEHLMKFNSKRKKSELNNNAEMFATEVMEKHGSGTVKVKVEVEAFMDDEELQETMRRHSKALQEKIAGLEEINQKEYVDIKFEEFRKKKAAEKVGKNRPPFHEGFRGRGRGGHGVRGGWGGWEEDYEEEEEGDDGSGWGWGRGSGRQSSYHGDYDEEPYPKRSKYNDSWDTFYDGPEMAHRDDYRRSYWDRFDPYRRPEDDPYYSRRLTDEKRRLDDLMLERHRLHDPYAERRRIADILERQHYLQNLERRRLDDILERRRRMGAPYRREDDEPEDDIDLIRLRRFEERELKLNLASGSQSARDRGETSTSARSEDRASLEAILARRRALETSAEKREGIPMDEDLRPRHQSRDARTHPTAAAVVEEKPSEPLPGLGPSTPASSRAVPSFLRQPQGAPPPTSDQASGETLPQSLTQKTNTQMTKALASLAKFINPSQPTSQPQKPTTSEPSKPAPVVDTANVDQPQQLLLESIRLQTELIKQSLANVNKSGNKTKAQSRPQAACSQASAPPVSSVACPPSSVAVSQTPVSGYTTQYYQHNFHMNVPNLAPQSTAVWTSQSQQYGSGQMTTAPTSRAPQQGAGNQRPLAAYPHPNSAPPQPRNPR